MISAALAVPALTITTIVLTRSPHAHLKATKGEATETTTTDDTATTHAEAAT